jgi:uncharacterized protein YjbI with pentapeptide repeats
MGTSLDQANLTNADLKGANLDSADLTGVTWSSTICADGTVSNNRLLGTCGGS